MTVSSSCQFWRCTSWQTTSDGLLLADKSKNGQHDRFKLDGARFSFSSPKEFFSQASASTNRDVNRETSWYDTVIHTHSHIGVALPFSDQEVYDVFLSSCQSLETTCVATKDGRIFSFELKSFKRWDAICSRASNVAPLHHGTVPSTSTSISLFGRSDHSSNTKTRSSPALSATFV